MAAFVAARAFPHLLARGGVPDFTFVSFFLSLDRTVECWILAYGNYAVGDQIKLIKPRLSEEGGSRLRSCVSQ